MTSPMRRPVLFLGVLVALLFTAGAAISAEKNVDKTKDLPLIRSVKDPIVRVNGKEITEENLRIAVNNVMPMLSFHTSVSDKRFKAIRKETLEKLIDNELIYGLAVSKKEDKITDKEFQEGLDALKKRLAPGDTIEKVLKRSNLTMDGLRNEIKYNIIVARIRKDTEDRLRKEAEGVVTEKYMRDYYNTHLDKFVEPARLHLRGILIKVEPGASQRVWMQAKKKIYQIADEARKGADFAELAKKYSQSQGAANGGDMGWAHEGSLLPDIEQAVSGLKIGDISKPVMSIYGFHLFKLEDKKPSRQKKYSELNHKRLKAELVDKEFRTRWDAWLKGLRKNAKIEYLRRI